MRRDDKMVIIILAICVIYMAFITFLLIFGRDLLSEEVQNYVLRDKIICYSAALFMISFSFWGDLYSIKKLSVGNCTMEHIPRRTYRIPKTTTTASC